MDKWLILLASLGGVAAAPQDAQATVQSGAHVSTINLSDSLWMLGQCVSPSHAARALSVVSVLMQIHPAMEAAMVQTGV